MAKWNEQSAKAKGSKKGSKRPEAASKEKVKKEAGSGQQKSKTRTRMSQAALRAMYDAGGCSLRSSAL